MLDRQFSLLHGDGNEKQVLVKRIDVPRKLVHKYRSIRSRSVSYFHLFLKLKRFNSNRLFLTISLRTILMKKDIQKLFVYVVLVIVGFLPNSLFAESGDINKSCV